MRHSVFYLALGLVALAPAVASAQAAQQPAHKGPVVLENRNLSVADVGTFELGFGRPTTFDDMRLDVRESLRPRQSYGPVSNVTCSPSVPDC